MNKYIDSLLLDLLKLATKITSPEEVIANFPKLNTIEWEELRKAAEVFVVCVRLASVNKLLENV